MSDIWTSCCVIKVKSTTSMPPRKLHERAEKETLIFCHAFEYFELCSPNTTQTMEVTLPLFQADLWGGLTWLCDWSYRILPKDLVVVCQLFRETDSNDLLYDFGHKTQVWHWTVVLDIVCIERCFLQQRSYESLFKGGMENSYHRKGKLLSSRRSYPAERESNLSMALANITQPEPSHSVTAAPSDGFNVKYTSRKKIPRAWRHKRW